MDDIEGLKRLAREHLYTSEILLEKEQYNFSIAHSYYCMFSIAKSLLYNIDCTPKTHEGLISTFSYEMVKKRGFNSDYFKFLTDARDMRTSASYDFTANFDENQAKEKINQCYNFIEESNKYF